ncbi:chorismate synthase, partial [Staphylococcus aureus]
TLYKPLQSVDIDSKETFNASVERSDSCAVPAASVVAEAVVAWEVAVAVLEKFDGDRFDTLKKHVEEHRNLTKEF